MRPYECKAGSKERRQEDKGAKLQTNTVILPLMLHGKWQENLKQYIANITENEK